jgi:WD40 repeat protein
MPASRHVWLLLVAVVPALRSAEKHVDRQGDPLPKEAVARLGTVRWRLGGYVYGLAFAPDGKTLASAANDDTVRLWDADDGKERRRFPGHPPFAITVAISPDGTKIASGGADHRIRLGDLATGKTIHEWKAHDHDISCLAFAPDGKTLASGSGFFGGGDAYLRLWAVSTGKELVALRHGSPVRSVAFTPDGKHVVSAGGKRVRASVGGSHRQGRPLFHRVP